MIIIHKKNSGKMWGLLAIAGILLLVVFSYINSGSFGNFTTNDVTDKSSSVTGQKQNNNPSVSATHTPQYPYTYNTVTFTATAKAQKGYVKEIILYVDGRLAKDCTNKYYTQNSTSYGSVEKCQYTGGPYNAGTHSYYAKAVDSDGNTGKSSDQQFYVYQYYNNKTQ